ncbi:hypothetical protein DIPPA_27104 [Diplonema papillatum]|nr:hypothetical protein DIPPA_27104 [Diplonema papillatum]
MPEAEESGEGEEGAVEVVQHGKKLYIDRVYVADVAKNGRSGGGLTVTFVEHVPLEHCAEVMLAVAYSNVAPQMKAGTRSYQLRFNAGDGAADSRVRLDIDLLPPILFAPAFTKAASYTEGAQPLSINPKVNTSLPPAQPLAGASVVVEITGNCFESEDELDFSNPQLFDIDSKGVIYGKLLGSRGHMLGRLVVWSSGKLEIVFPQDTQAAAKHVNSLLRAFRYFNCSADPNIDTRTVTMSLFLDSGVDANAKRRSVVAKPVTWPVKGLQAGMLEVALDVVAVDDQTVVVPRVLALARTSVDGLVYVFEGCTVSDEDTPLFLAPHSYLEVLVSGSEKLAAHDHRLNIATVFPSSRRTGLHIEGGSLYDEWSEQGWP